MSTVTGAASTTRTKPGLDEQLNWLYTAYRDLHDRAAALEHFISTAHSWRVEADCAPDSDGAPTILTVRVDRDAWFAAVNAAQAPRPAFPGTQEAECQELRA
jgi:hypothetical protein